MEAMDRLSPENGATEVENILLFWREAKANEGRTRTYFIPPSLCLSMSLSSTMNSFTSLKER